MAHEQREPSFTLSAITRDRGRAPEALEPGYDRSRPIAAPGHAAVDLERRVDFRRRHDDRLGVTLFPVEERFIANRD